MRNTILNFLIILILIGASFPFVINTNATIDDYLSDNSFRNHDGFVNCVSWAPNSTELVSCDSDGDAMIWKWNETDERIRYAMHSDDVLSAEWSPNEMHIASSSASGKAKVWSTITGNSEATFLGHYDGVPDNRVTDISWSPNSDKVVSCSEDGEILIWYWNVANPDDMEILSFTQHTDQVRCVDWSPGGDEIASGGNDSKVFIWNPQNGNVDQELTSHSDTVNDVAWSQDGTKLATASSDNTVKIWNADTGAELFVYEEHIDDVLCVDWSLDSSKIVTGSADRDVKVWDPDTGYTYVNFTGHTQAVSSVDWSPDDEMIASASRDGTIDVWLLTAPPIQPEINIPKTSVKRGNTTRVYGRTESYFSLPDQLTAEFQYKLRNPGGNPWSDSMFTNPVSQGNWWYVDFEPELDTETGYYDIRVRFQDPNGLYSNWETKAQGLRVINNKPVIENILGPVSLFRTETSTMYVAVSDEEDYEDELAVAAQYSLSDEETITWRSDIFTEPIFDDNEGKWGFDLTFPKTSKPGLYDIRIRAEDKDGSVSDWYDMNHQINLHNNLPSVANLTLSPSVFHRGECGVIWIDPVDLEDGSDILDARVEVKNSTSDWTPLPVNHNEDGINFSVCFNTTLDHELGQYRIRVSLEDRDHGMAPWYYYNSTLELMNNPPEIFEEFTVFHLYSHRSREFSLWDLAWDTEDPKEELVWSIKTAKTNFISATVKNNNILNITPVSMLSVGEFSIALTVKDKDGDRRDKSIFVNIHDWTECPDVGIFQTYPLDQITLSDNTPELKWDINYTERSPSYAVHMGLFPDQISPVREGIIANSYTTEELIDGMTYYWMVEVSFFGVYSTFRSNIRSFKVDLDFEPEHDISIEFDTIQLTQLKEGYTTTFNVTVSNDGNVPEEITLTVLGAFDSFTQLEHDSFLLHPKDDRDIKLTVHWPDLDLMASKFFVKAVSADTDISQSIPFEKSERESSSEGNGGSGASWVWFILIIIIVLGLGLGIALFIWKKKKDVDDRESEPQDASMDLLAMGMGQSNMGPVYGGIPSQGYQSGAGSPQGYGGPQPGAAGGPNQTQAQVGPAPQQQTGAVPSRPPSFAQGARNQKKRRETASQGEKAKAQPPKARPPRAVQKVTAGEKEITKQGGEDEQNQKDMGETKELLQTLDRFKINITQQLADLQARNAPELETAPLQIKLENLDSQRKELMEKLSGKPTQTLESNRTAAEKPQPDSKPIPSPNEVPSLMETPHEPIPPKPPASVSETQNPPPPPANHGDKRTNGPTAGNEDYEDVLSTLNQLRSSLKAEKS